MSDLTDTMIYWNRGEVFKLATNLSTDEFKCKCGHCEEQKISPRLVINIQNVRDHCNEYRPRGNPEVKIKINSGYRCQAYNGAIRNAAPYSPHIKGLAADIVVVNGPEFDRLERMLAMFGFSAVTPYINPKRFHVDVRDPKTAPWGFATWNKEI